MEKGTQVIEPTGIGVFLKYPEPGRVKTRLAQTIGPEKAAALYHQMIERVITQSLKPLSGDAFEITLFCDPGRSLQDYEALLADHPYSLALQAGEDLGKRLAHTFEALFQKHQTAIIIGTDCIEIRPEHFQEARDQLLAGQDLMLGPAKDGGYYLIGLNQLRPELFEGIAWSTDQVLAQTLEKAKTGHYLLPVLEDIDTIEDLKKCPSSTFS